MNKESFAATVLLREKATEASKKVEALALAAAVEAMKTLFNIDVRAEETSDKHIRYYFNTNSIWAYEGWVTIQKHDGLSGGLVKEYEIFLPDLFSE